MIIGEMTELSLAFSRLAAADHSSLLLVGSDRERLWQSKQQLAQSGIQKVYHVVEDLSAPQADLQVYESWLLHSLLQESPQPLDLLINVLSFQTWAWAEADPWEEIGPEPTYHLNNLLGINRLMAEEMAQQGQGHILNVLSRADPGTGPWQEMFVQTQALLLDFACHLNQQLARTPVAVSTLSVSGRSFVLQGDALPSSLALPLLPAQASLQAIANYGYQMVRRVA